MKSLFLFLVDCGLNRERVSEERVESGNRGVEYWNLISTLGNAHTVDLALKLINGCCWSLVAPFTTVFTRRNIINIYML